MKARMMLISSSAIMTIRLLVSPIGAQAVPPPIGWTAPASDRSVVDQAPLSTTALLTGTQPLLSDQDSSAPGRATGDIGSSPYHQERHRLTDNDFDDRGPVAAFNPQRDEYLIVWTQCNGPCDIVGQRVTRQGISISNSFTITTGDDEAFPVIGYNSYYGEYLVVYERHVSSIGHLYGRIILGNGTLWGSEFTIAGESGSQIAPEIAFNPTATNHGHPGEYLVVYQANTDIVAKHISSYGEVDASSHLIAGSADLTNPDAAYNPVRNEYLVAYTEIVSNTPPVYRYDVLARRIAADAALLGSTIGLAVGPDNANTPEVAVGNDTYFVAYADGPSDSADSTSIAGIWITGAGVPLSAPIGKIAEAPPNSLRLPRVAYAGQGFLVAWGSREEVDTANIYGRYVRLQPGFWSEVFAIDAGPYGQVNDDVACAIGSCLIVDGDYAYDHEHGAEITAWNLWLQQAFLPLVRK